MEHLKKIQAFNRDKDVMRLQRMFKDSSILEVVGVERKETRHSKFLEWLFKTPEFNTVSQVSPIMHLLDVILRRDEEQNNVIDRDFKKDVITRKSNVRIDDVNREVTTTGLKLQGKEGKIDLYIKAYDKKTGKTIHICIENKVDSNEHDNQTLKYYAYLLGNTDYLSIFKGIKYSFDKNKYQCPTNEEDIKLFVFLTPSAEFIMKNKEMRDSMCECDKYIHINYQDIVNEILNPLSEDGATSLAAMDKIEQYVCSLGVPGGEVKDEEGNNNFKTIMASGEDILQLSVKIYYEYKDLIVDAILKDDYKDFKKSHKAFLINLLNTINHHTTDEEEYYKTQFLILRMNEKFNNFLVRNNGKYRIYNQTEFAVEFARLYFNMKFQRPILNVVGVVQKLNADFASVKSDLFSMTHKKKNSANQYLNDRLVEGYGIFFANNVWGTGNYLAKLEVFIQNQQVVNKCDFEIVRSL